HRHHLLSVPFHALVPVAVLARDTIFREQTLALLQALLRLSGLDLRGAVMGLVPQVLRTLVLTRGVDTGVLIPLHPVDVARLEPQVGSGVPKRGGSIPRVEGILPMSIVEPLDLLGQLLPALVRGPAL